MGTLTIHVGEWSLVVPFTLDGVDVARKFLDLLGRVLTEKEAEG